MEKICVITGGTSGIGKCTAEAMVKKGYTVYELSRREAGNPGMYHIPTDVTDPEACQRAIDAVYSQAGRIDVMINNAGFGISGAIEFTPIEQAKRQLDVNFFGMVNMNHAVIPVMRRQGVGRIVNLSSVAGAIAIPFQAFYSASKAAINSYTMALANEVKPFGVEVCCVQPGDIQTGFTAARQKIVIGDDIYNGRISRSVAGMEKDETTGMKPEQAGAFVCHVATRKGVRPVNTIGLSYKFFCVLQKHSASEDAQLARRRSLREIRKKRDGAIRPVFSRALPGIKARRRGKTDDGGASRDALVILNKKRFQFASKC